MFGIHLFKVNLFQCKKGAFSSRLNLDLFEFLKLDYYFEFLDMDSFGSTYFF